MVKQSFIIRLEDQDGHVVDFERFIYKRVETCVGLLVELYKRYERLYMPNLDKAARVVAYPTPDGYHMEDPVWSVSVEEFRKMVEKEKEEERNDR